MNVPNKPSASLAERSDALLQRLLTGTLLALAASLIAAAFVLYV